MKTRSLRIWGVLLLLVVLATGTILPVAARENQPEAVGESVMLRLKYATFDPLQGEPRMSPALQLDAYQGTGEGAYIVQFKEPIEEAWTDQVRALGGRVMDYLPDFSFLVWMDAAVQKRVAVLDTVRWVGLYQPAYKLSPNLDRTKSIYRVVLFEGADLGAVEARLDGLDTPTSSVAGERFTLFLPEGGVEEVANWPEVLWIENRPFYRLSNDVATGIMGATTAWASDYTGADQMVTVADTGIDSGVDDSSMHPDFQGRFDEIYDWSYTGGDGCGGCCFTTTPDGPTDWDGHGTHVLGSVLGDGTASSGAIKGPAYEAIPTFQSVGQYVDFTPLCEGQDYRDGVYPIALPDDLGALFSQAYGDPPKRYIHSNSWGSHKNGEYTADSQAVDQFVWDHKDMLILFSAGNAGVDGDWDGYVDEDSLDAPGTAKNALTVGASENYRLSGGYNPGGDCSTYYGCWGFAFPFNPTKDDRLSDDAEELAAFSSRGPTDDGRLKPDVVAPGTNILSTRSAYGAGGEWGAYDDYYEYMGGTSMATPLVAGAAAQVRQYYVEGREYATPSAALLKATLINSAVDIVGYGNGSEEAGLPIPNNHEGWGRVDVSAATSGEHQFLDGASVRTGDTSGPHSYYVGYSAAPFKVTLVWSDYPGSPTSGGLVNDLDLVVRAPGGSPTYYGNDLSGGWSVPGVTADRSNNVESVYIQNPTVGYWTVRVTGYNVPQGGSQPFALVVTLASSPPLPPEAAFSADPISGNRPLEVSFTDESTGGEITSWEWDFGDTGTSAAQHPTHTYEEAGDYTVSLTVTGPGGSDTETKVDYIHVTAPSLTVTPVAGEPGSYFAFTGENWPADVEVTISVNGTDLAQTVETDGVGAMEFALHTAVGMSPGRYLVTARTNPSAMTYFDLDPDAPLSPDPGLETTIEVPETIEPATRVYLPLVMKGYTPVGADPP